ncbi:MAG TPA: HAD hydrolase-like protein [Actinotalea caeni]|uniref:HAD hydrolase-like protein n=1 Tax=Actinotalea caeni TaxID=1348467 RepID=UPI0012E22A0A|nr:HAD hydrolase-like protein [Actinotalea caeni]HLV56483.1 HAD hydrolase-like protein [Actinotalea caeni]
MTAPLVLLDLDGTLSDSAPGIVRSARHALTTLGLPVPSDAQLRAFVGPPLPVALRAHGVPEDRLLDGVAAYREAFEAGGMWESELFDGIPEQLRLLREAGCTLAVATSKPEVYARPICERRGVDVLVDGVYGAPLDHVPSTKASVITHALAELGPQRVPGTERILMVGDRHHDVEGAAEHGIACLGVGWGYGEPGELDGAVGVVPDVASLAAAVLDHLAGVSDAALPAGSHR